MPLHETCKHPKCSIFNSSKQRVFSEVVSRVNEDISLWTRQPVSAPLSSMLNVEDVTNLQRKSPFREYLILFGVVVSEWMIFSNYLEEG